MNVSKRTIISACLCVMLLFYLLVAVSWSRFAARNELCRGLEDGRIEVVDPDGLGFITSEALQREIFAQFDSLELLTYARLNLDDISRRLNSMDKLEKATVTRLSDDRLRIRAYPMRPVARIWPGNGQKSYYVNRDGKRMTATSRFSIDVPQVKGRFDSLRSETALLPLLDYLARNPDMESLVTMIDASDTTNIMLVPAIRGHLVNIGAPRHIDNKMSRLLTFYHRVLPMKGWEFYDTISVKWNRQVVATRRKQKMPDPTVRIIDELENEGDDLATMSTEYNTTQ